MYQKEQAAEQNKVESLREEGADPHDIKYAVRSAADSGLTRCSLLPLLRKKKLPVLSCFVRRTSW